MKKKTFLLLSLQLSFFLLSGVNIKAQVFNGTLNLITQAQVDAFNFTSVTGDLILFSPSIINLNGLSELQTIGGNFEISTTGITNVDPLSNLQSANSMLIRGNALLTNLNGFSGLTSVPRGFHFQNNSTLTNFDGLLSVTGTIEGIEISNCPMTNLNGFTSILDITGFIELESNPFLANVDGLAGLQGADVVNSIEIISNPLLQNINGLSSITDAGAIEITGNQILSNLDGLANVETATDIVIRQNPALTGVDGLSGIQLLTGSLWIRSNSSLTNINGLTNLTSIGKELLIDFNGNLTNIDGLSNLTKITNVQKLGANVIIHGNAKLINLNGLQNLTEIANDLKITNNQVLVDFCGLSKLFDEGTIGGIIDIKNNGANTVLITPPPDIILNNDPGLCSRDVSAVVPTPATVTGCLDPSPPGRSDYPPGNIFPVGTTNIRWSATDGAGNTATAIQQVIISDNEAPSITCPSTVNVQCAADVPAVNTASVTASDNCSVNAVTHVGDVISNQTCANRFTLTRTYKATDGSGNTAICSQTITVNDNVSPQITGLSASKQILAPPNHKMQDITVNYSVLDNCDNSYTFNVNSNESVNGTGDGDTDPDWEIINDHTIRLRAERAATGTGRVYTIMVTANDGCNAAVTSSVQVVVAHNVTGPHSGQSFKVGTTVAFTGEFWDVPMNKHTAKWLIDGNTIAKATVTEPSGAKNGKV
ncbi:MAG TPA: hypothetical protein VFH07_05090, partial [Chitinophagaceae bacterium]|nr:hypothetical protein [Chitinophagaceae bacterium]